MADIQHVEQQRLELESSVSKLQTALDEWRQWEIEYEEFREDLQRGENIEVEFLLGSATDHQLLDPAERRRLIFDKQRLRVQPEILGLVDRRLEYVQRNIRSLEDALEMKQRGTEDPLVEIVEQLDDDGNFVSGSTTSGQQAHDQALQALRKAGIEQTEEHGSQQRHDQALQGLHTAGIQQTEEKEIEADTSGQQGHDRALQGLHTAASQQTEEKEIEADTSGQQGHDRALQALQTAGIQQSEDGAVVYPEESEEDARLRREMLDYSLQEVGVVVAELDLDESGSEFDLNFDSSDESSEEDVFGRSSHRVLTDDYLAEMRRLERKLGMVNVGQDPGEEVAVPKKEPVISSDKKLAVSSEKKNVPKLKKGVRFASELDIQEAPTVSQESNASQINGKSINAANVVERPFDPHAKRDKPDDLNPRFVQRQLTEQYQRTQNRMIGQQGGFRNPDDCAEVPLEETGEYGGRKVSRFRAARLGLR